MEKESKELYEKSRLLMKQKDDLLTRLSTMRFENYHNNNNKKKEN